MEQLSVITICFNNLSDLQTTCSSVDAQSAKPYEHYIIDGSSNKEIAEWLQNTPQPSYRKWLCERDKGISDAFNKGLALSSGSLIHILNSADIYYSNSVIENVLAYFFKNTAVQWASGNIFMKRAGIWVNIGVPFDAGQLYKGMRAVSHPTWFLRKDLYNKVGNFSLDFKIAGKTGVVCMVNEQPIYRKCFYNQSGTDTDETISHTNGDAIRQANIRFVETEEVADVDNDPFSL